MQWICKHRDSAGLAFGESLTGICLPAHPQWLPRTHAHLAGPAISWESPSRALLVPCLALWAKWLVVLHLYNAISKHLPGHNAREDAAP